MRFLTAIKKLNVELEDKARFEPGSADLLEVYIMEKGSMDGRSVINEKGCTFRHSDVWNEGKVCFCGNTAEDEMNGTKIWD